MKTRHAVSTLIAAFAALFLATGGAASAATLTVTNTLDSGPGSLRAAIANGLSGDTVNFAAALNGQTIGLTTGQIVISTNLTIQGPGANLLTVRNTAGAGSFRTIFRVANVVTAASISGLTIAGGNAEFGGGIFNEGVLAFANCTISDNSSVWGGGIWNSNGARVTLANCTISGNATSPSGGPDAYGGGIWNDEGGTAILTNCTISSNSAETAGGGIGTNGTVTLTNCAISGNSATAGGGIASNGMVTLTTCTISGNQSSINGGSAAAGGGIDNNGTLTVIGTTISGNSATLGGGIWNFNGATVTVANSTISSNSAISNSGGGGGGIGNAGTLTVTNSTISGNFTTDGGGGIGNFGTTVATNSTIYGNTANRGGGIQNIDGALAVTDSTISANNATYAGGLESGAATLMFGNTILAGNTAGLSPDLLVANPVNTNISLGYNLIGTTSGFFGSLQPTDIVNPTPKLGPLANNGGPTQTVALLPGSPAIDAGSVALIPVGITTDQRGTGFPRITNNKVDIGAYEVQTPPNFFTGSVGGVDLGYSASVGSETFAVFVFDGAGTQQSQFTGGQTAITGNIGVAYALQQLQITGGASVSGNAWLNTGINFSKVLSGGSKVVGGAVQNAATDTNLAKGVSDANAASTVAAGLTPNLTNPNWKQKTNTLSIVGGPNPYVVNFDNNSKDGFQLNGGSTLQIVGTPGQNVIINVWSQKGVNLSGGSTVVLSGGLIPANVLLNVYGTQPQVQISGGGTFNGIILAPKVQQNLQISGGSAVNGEVIANSAQISGGSAVKRTGSAP